MKRKYFNIIFAILVFASILLLSDKSVQVMKELVTSETDQHANPQVIVIDAGHGGFDPGKVGVNGALEKDINLHVALELKRILTESGFEVVLTRETDTGLYDESDSNKKSTDMKRRVELIDKTNPILAVSIHQNSFIQESSRGAQVFYYGNSVEGKEFAAIMQSTLKEYLQDGNHRTEKANDSYYMLKKTSCPLVIVECGFLSNYNEADLLASKEYQQKLAWAIQLGILRFLDGK